MARRFGWKMQRVSNWRKTNFPSDTYPAITGALADLGIQAVSTLWLTIPSAVLDTPTPGMIPVAPGCGRSDNTVGGTAR